MECGLGYVSCFAPKIAEYTSQGGCRPFSSQTLLYGCECRVLAQAPYLCLIALTYDPT